MKKAGSTSLASKIRGTYSMAVIASFATAMTLLCANDVWQYRSRFIAETAVEAEFLSKNVEAALKFEDAQTAQAFLSSLSSNPDIEAAALYLPDGKLVANHLPQERVPPTPPTDPDASPKIDFRKHECWKLVYAADPVRGDGIVGTLYLKYSWNSFWITFITDMAVLLATFAVAHLVGSAVLRKGQKKIVEPIENLTRTTMMIAREQDYAVEIPVETTDEVARLTESFNEMLRQINRREAELVRSKEILEVKVAHAGRQLAASTVGLEHATEDLRKFFSIFHHDIQSPALRFAERVAEVLSSIEQGAALAARQVTPDAYRTMRSLSDKQTMRDLRALMEASHAVHETFGAIAEIARISTRKIRMQDVAMQYLLEDAVREVAPRAHAAEVSIAVSVEDGTIETDRGALQEIVVAVLERVIALAEAAEKKRLNLCAMGTCSDWAITVGGPGLTLDGDEKEHILDIFPTDSPYGKRLACAAALGRRMNVAVELSQEEGPVFRIKGTPPETSEEVPAFA